MKCLKVKEPFASLIVCGEKIWEIRRKPTFIREKIAIGSTDRKRVIGYATLADCWSMPVEQLKKHGNFHFATQFLDKYANGKKNLNVWLLSEASIEKEPYPYSFSTGSWCHASKDELKYEKAFAESFAASLGVNIK